MTGSTDSLTDWLTELGVFLFVAPARTYICLFIILTKLSNLLNGTERENVHQLEKSRQTIAPKDDRRIKLNAEKL